MNSQSEGVTTINGCRCGSKITSRANFACNTSKGGQLRCPCVRNGQLCSTNCKCRHCANTTREQKKGLKSICRCGEERRNVNDSFVSCSDVEGKNRTRCPCFSNNIGCINCKCYNCGNIFGRRNQTAEKKKKRTKTVLSSPPSLKRKRGNQYLLESGLKDLRSGWTQIEACILHVVESYIYTICVTPSCENIHYLYNKVISSSAAKVRKIGASAKSQQQVSGKLSFISRKRETLCRRNLGGESLDIEIC